MIKPKWILLITFLAGIFILALPDNGEPIISFNKMHGPSLQDMIGLIFISISWLVSIVIIGKNWKKIRNSIGQRNIFLLLTTYLLSCIAIILGLESESDWILWSSIFTASIVNILLIVLSFSKTY
jgi:hypothetical protein